MGRPVKVLASSPVKRVVIRPKDSQVADALLESVGPNRHTPRDATTFSLP